MLPVHLRPSFLFSLSQLRLPLLLLQGSVSATSNASSQLVPLWTHLLGCKQVCEATGVHSSQRDAVCVL